jgi:glutamine synthetase type III
MIDKALAFVGALLCCSLFANYSQYQRAVAVEHKHIAENLKATINAYVAASELTAKRQSYIDAETTKSIADERDRLAKIAKSKEETIKELRRLNNEKPFPANCRIDVERVRTINKKLSNRRRG